MLESLETRLALSSTSLAADSIVAPLTVEQAGAAAALSAANVLPGDQTISAAAGDQSAPALALGGDTFLAVWSDSRANVTGGYEGETSHDIYGVRLDADGNLLDPVPLAIVANKASQGNPQVSWNGSNWLVVYESYDISGTGYYYQRSLEAVRVSPTGQVLDAQPITLHGLSPAGYGKWAVESDGDNWVVVNEGSATTGDIVAVRISAAGQVLDPPTRTLVDATYYGRSNLRLAYAGGVFLLTFDDPFLYTGYATLAVRFSPDLTLLDSEPVGLVGNALSDLASNGSQFYAVWNQQQPDFSMVVTGSRVGTDGVKLDGNGVNISGTNPAQAFAAIGVAWDGVNWKVSWGNNNAVRLARVAPSGQVLDPGGVAVSGPQTGPSAGNGNGGLQFVWTTFANNNYDVFAANISSNNSAGPNRTLSVGAPRQLRPDVATNGAGYMVVYHSSTSSGSRVLAQPLDADGNPLTADPIELEAASGTSGLSYPSVAWNGSVYMAVWGDASGVVAQRLQPDGTKVDASPVVVMSASFGPARVAALGHDFLVVGRKVGFSPQYVFPVAARVRGTDGAVLDATPLVLGNSYLRTSPQVVALGDRWLVAWHRNATHDDSFALTQGAFVNPDGTATAEFTIHGPFSTAGGNGSFEVGLASNGNVALMVQSQELTSGVETDLLARFIQADGTVSPMTNLTPWSGNQYKPRVAWDGTNFIVAYHEQRNRNAPWTLDQLDARSDLFGMRITPTGSIVDPQGFVFSSLPTGETDPTVTALNGVTLIAGSRMVNDTTFANYRVMYEQLGRNNNQWPVGVVSASATSGDVPLVVNFNSLGSTDPDGSIASYLWDFGDGVTSTLADPNHIFTTPGEYLVSLTLTDNGGAQTTQAVLVNATAPNQLPVAVASADKTSGKAPLAVVFSSKGSYDPDGFVGNIQWQFSDGGQYWGSTAYHTFTTVGSHTATLTVFDSRGATSSTSLTIDVVGINQPPVAVAEATPTSGNVPLVVQFDSSGSFDPDGTITSYFWNFGDAFGTTSTEPNPSYTYNYAGTYTAQLTVTDDNNVSSSSNVTITVAPAPLPLLRSYDIALSANVKRNRATVSGTVTVVDENFRTVQGAAVTIAWLRPDGSLVTQSATTDRRGKAKFSTTSGLGTYTLTVKDILLTGYAFDTVNGVLSSSITA